MRRARISGPVRSVAIVGLVGLMLLPAAASGKTYVPHGTPDDTPVYKPRSFVAGSGVGGGVLGFSGMRVETSGDQDSRGAWHLQVQHL